MPTGARRKRLLPAASMRALDCILLLLPLLLLCCGTLAGAHGDSSSRAAATTTVQPLSNQADSHASPPAATNAAATAASSAEVLDLSGLSGARLLRATANLTHAHAHGWSDTPPYAVQWSAPNTMTDAGALGSPLLRYTVFAEWHSDLGEAHSSEVCSTEQPGALECSIPAGALEGNTTVSLRLLTECASSAETRRCRSSLSAPLELRVPPTAAQRRAAHRRARPPGTAHPNHAAWRRRNGVDVHPAMKATFAFSALGREIRHRPPVFAQGADPFVRAAAAPPALSTPPPDMALVKAALCDFFNVSSGYFSWTNTAGWCTQEELCQWYGVSCDKNGTYVSSLMLSDNGLALLDYSYSYLPLFRMLPGLRSLDLSWNGWLGNLDLSPLVNLAHLSLRNFNQPLAGGGGDGSSSGPTQPPPWTNLSLPLQSVLLDIDVSWSGLGVDFSRTPSLISFNASQNYAPLEIASLWNAPDLVVADFTNSGLTSSKPPPGSGFDPYFSGGDLTQFVLSNLNESNPRLQVLLLASTPLPFGVDGAYGSNWPSIRSDSLRVLDISFLTQLFSGRGGAGPTWLEAMPSLETLLVGALLSASVDTIAFARASRELSHVDTTFTALEGDLSPLEGLAQLQILVLDSSNVKSFLAPNLASVWPRLVRLSARAGLLFGPIPSFAGLANLTLLALSSNDFEGRLPANFVQGCAQLTSLQLDDNPLLTGHLPNLVNPLLTEISLQGGSLVGPLPRWELRLLDTLSLAANPLGGSIPQGFWEGLPRLRNVDMSYCALKGIIPPAAQPRSFSYFVLSGNQLQGGLPGNISARHYDLSFNQLEGEISLEDYDSRYATTFLGLSFNSALSCPISLGSLTSLLHLDLQNAGIVKCDFTDASQVSLPKGIIEFLDISDNAWRHFTLQVEPQHVSVQATNASVTACSFGQSGTNARDQVKVPFLLQTLVLDDNRLDPASQFTSLSSLSILNSTLRRFSCRNCDLILPLFVLAAPFYGTSTSVLQEVDLSSNFLSGTLPGSWFLWTIPNEVQSAADPWTSWPLSLQVLNLANNLGVTGRLPEAGTGYTSLARLDVSYTSIEGEIPDSWSNFPALEQLNLHGAGVRCHLTQTATGSLNCSLPSFLTRSHSSTEIQGLNASADGTGPNLPGVHCPLLNLAASATLMEIDPDYYRRSLCTCDANHFGRDGNCMQCPVGCTCIMDVVSGCFPIIQLGWLSLVNSSSDPDGDDMSAQAQVINPFVVVAMLPCPRTSSGETMCNPGSKMEWTAFYALTPPPSIVGQAGLSPYGPQWNVLPTLEGWCAEGHEGRLCAQCSDGWFLSTPWCVRCLGTAVHALILLANIGVLLALVIFLYHQQPKAHRAQRALRYWLYQGPRATRNTTTSVTRGGEERRRSTVSESRPRAPSVSDNGATRSVNNSGGTSTAAAVSAPAPTPRHIIYVDEVDPSPANPLRMLIFHTQRLSLLLLTGSSMPSALSGLMSLFSSGGNGFSLSSLTAMECVSSYWRLPMRCWASVITPVLIGAVAGLNWFRSRRRQARAQAMAASAAAMEHSMGVAMGADSVSRVYGVCLSMLYLAIFPCAQTSLSALACTDWRELSDRSNPSAAAMPRRIYLTLYPNQQCDEEWAESILPPALIGAVFWCILFPVISTVLLRRLHRHLTRAGNAGGMHETKVTLQLWAMASELLKPYDTKFWYWEQLLLARRLLLAACVCFVSQDSLYLPLGLFALIQLSVLLQLWAKPYRHRWMNRGELVSLYLLLLNYISALVAQSDTQTDDASSTADSAWVVALFFANLLFILCLVLGLFAFVRALAAARSAEIEELWARCTGWVARIWSVRFGRGGASSAGSAGLKGPGDGTGADGEEEEMKEEWRVVKYGPGMDMDMDFDAADEDANDDRFRPEHFSPRKYVASPLESIDSHSSSDDGGMSGANDALAPGSLVHMRSFLAHDADHEYDRAPEPSAPLASPPRVGSLSELQQPLL